MDSEQKMVLDRGISSEGRRGHRIGKRLKVHGTGCNHTDIVRNTLSGEEVAVLRGQGLHANLFHYFYNIFIELEHNIP